MALPQERDRPAWPPGGGRRWQRVGAAVVVAAIVALAGCGRRDAALADCRLPADATVLAIGDSLTRGHGAGGAGYPEQLQALLRDVPQRADVRVVNLGVDGERSAGLLARVDAAIAEHRPAVVLITSGGNDFLRRVSADDTRRHLLAVLESVRGAGAFAIVFAIPQPSLGAAVGLPDEHPLFDELADEAGVHVIDDVVADVLARDELKSDRIHPNREGYARMAQAAFDALQRCR
jgi:lysophospholipase L1-like esterase